MTTRILPAHGLARSLAAARDAAGGRSPLPDRGELQATLTSALLGPVALAEYLDALAAAGTAPGPNPAADGLPAGRVVADGLDWVPDGQLAGLALDRDAVRTLNAAVEAALLDGTAGAGWWAAVDLADDALPPDYLPPDRASRLADEGIAATRQSATPTVVPRSIIDAQPAGGYRLQWASLAALAASVLGFGVLLGTQFRSPPREVASLTPDELSRNLPPATRDSLLRLWGEAPRGGVLPGEARTRPEPAKGPEAFVLEVKNGDDRRAYVTVVGLSAGKRPTFQTKAPAGGGDQWIAVEPGETRAVIPSAVVEHAETFLVVLTPTPAGELVRDFVLRPPAGAAPEAVRDALAAELTSLGYASLNTFLVRPPAANP